MPCQATLAEEEDFDIQGGRLRLIPPVQELPPVRIVGNSGLARGIRFNVLHLASRTLSYEARNEARVSSNFHKPMRRVM
jgi:hypothetical protein